MGELKKRPRLLRQAAVLALVAITIVFLYGRRQISGPDKGIAAPDFRAETYSGGEFSPGDHAGSKVLLVFYATWCGPCNDEMKHIVELDERFGPRGLQIAAVWQDPDKEDELKKIFSEQKKRPHYPFVKDTDGSIHELYNVNAWPTMVLIDDDGSVVGSYVGGKSRTRRAMEDSITHLYFDGAVD